MKYKTILFILSFQILATLLTIARGQSATDKSITGPQDTVPKAPLLTRSTNDDLYDVPKKKVKGQIRDCLSTFIFRKKLAIT